MAIAAEIQADLLATGAKALGIRLSETQTSRFVRYYDELARWNERVNLTSITEWEAVQSRHFLDSLSAALALSPQMLQSGSFIDVGSGGGFPGLPLKLAFPGMRGTLLEATAKKTAFLVHLSEILELEDISVRTGRAETLAHDAEMREAFDMALARAVAEGGDTRRTDVAVRASGRYRGDAQEGGHRRRTGAGAGGDRDAGRQAEGGAAGDATRTG